MYKHAFLLNYDGIPPELNNDAFVSCNWGDRTLVQLMVDVNDGELPEEHEEFLRCVDGMKTRCRHGDFVGRSVLVVETASPMTKGTLQAHVRSLSSEDLKRFIADARIG